MSRDNSEIPTLSGIPDVLYNVPANPACKWDGLTPYPHGVGGRHIHTCDFCEKLDDKTTMVGNHFVGGVLFVCPECQKGLTSCLTKIMGEHLWNLVDDGMKQIMVPRSNGSNEMWYIGSRLPTIHRGEWHLHVQSHRDLNESCLSKVVPVEKLKKLNNPKDA